MVPLKLLVTAVLNVRDRYKLLQKVTSYVAEPFLCYIHRFKKEV